MTVHASAVRMPFLISLLVGVLTAVAIALGLPSAAAAPDETRVPVRYDLTGTGVAGYITYQTNNGQAHATNAPLPWSLELSGWKTNSTTLNPYLLSAQTVGPGTLTCTVSVNGTVISESTATGNPARVLCENHRPQQ